MSNTPDQSPHDNIHDAISEFTSQPLSGTGAVVIVDEQGTPYRHKASAYEAFKSLADSFASRIPHGDRLMIILTAIIALSTIGQIWISWNNNTNSGKQVEKLIDAANRIDDAADSFSHSAANINNGINGAVTALSAQAGAAKTQADASLRSAKAQEVANNAVAKQFAMAQRPWITVDDSQFSFSQGMVWVANDAQGRAVLKQPSELMATPNDEILGNFHFELKGGFSNTGLSPALLVSQTVQDSLIKLPAVTYGDLSDNLDIPPLKDCARDFPLPTSGTITAGPKVPYEFHFPIQILDKEYVNEWIAGRRALVASGCFRYVDEFKERHQKNFCAYRMHGQPKWGICTKGNDDPW